LQRRCHVRSRDCSPQRHTNPPPSHCRTGRHLAQSRFRGNRSWDRSRPGYNSGPSNHQGIHNCLETCKSAPPGRLSYTPVLSTRLLSNQGDRYTHPFHRRSRVRRAGYRRPRHRYLRSTRAHKHRCRPRRYHVDHIEDYIRGCRSPDPTNFLSSHTGWHPNKPRSADTVDHSPSGRSFHQTNRDCMSIDLGPYTTNCRGSRWHSLGRRSPHLSILSGTSTRRVQSR